MLCKIDDIHIIVGNPLDHINLPILCRCMCFGNMSRHEIIPWGKDISRVSVTSVSRIIWRMHEPNLTHLFFFYSRVFSTLKVQHLNIII